MNITEAYHKIYNQYVKAQAAEAELHDHYRKMAEVYGENHEITEANAKEWEAARHYARGLFDALCVVSPMNTTHEN